MSDGENPRLAGEGRPSHEVGLLVGEPDRGDVDLAAAQRLKRVGEVEFGDVDLAVGAASLERSDDVDHVWPGRGTREQAQPEWSGEAVVVGSGLFEHGDELLVNGSDLVTEALTQAGELDVPAGAMDQLAAESAFELPQALTDTGLGQTEPFGGVAEVKLLGQGQKYPNLTQLNRVRHQDDPIVRRQGTSSSSPAVRCFGEAML